MNKIYWRTPMTKCDFNKIALELYRSHTSAWIFSCKFAAFFQNTFSLELFWTAASGKSYINFPVVRKNNNYMTKL